MFNHLHSYWSDPTRHRPESTGSSRGHYLWRASTAGRPADVVPVVYPTSFGFAAHRPSCPLAELATRVAPLGLAVTGRRQWHRGGDNRRLVDFSVGSEWDFGQAGPERRNHEGRKFLAQKTSGFLEVK